MERGYRAIITALNQGVVVLDSNKKAFFSNPAGLRMLGLTEDQLLQRAPMPPEWALDGALVNIDVDADDSSPQGALPRRSEPP